MASNILRKLKSRKIVIAIIAILLSLLLVGGMLFVTLSPQWARASGLDANKITQLVNNERAKAGLAALGSSPALAQAANSKSADMATYQYFSHYRPSDSKRGLSFITDSGYTYQSAGENLAVYFDTEQELVNAWMSSPTHKKNILSSNYSETGIGISQGIYKGYGTSFVVQFFAKPLAAVPAKPAQNVTSTSQAPTPQPVSTSSSQPETPAPAPAEEVKEEVAVSSSQSSDPNKLTQEEIDQLEQLLDKFFSNLRESSN